MMQRNYLEESLAQAIKANEEEDTQNALRLIKTITKNVGAISRLLTWQDAQGKNFLLLALESKNKTIIQKLLPYFESSPTLFNVDASQRSVLWHAVKLGDLEIFQQLLMSMERVQDPRDYQTIWGRADSEGVSPLQLAVKDARSEFVSYLLEKMRAEEHFIDLINRTNREGEAALHMAIHCENSQLIALLINHGAALDLLNNTQTSAFSLLLTKNQALQLRVYQALTKEKQTDFLSRYPKQHPNYVIFAGLHSLLHLVAFHFDSQPKAPDQSEAYSALPAEIKHYLDRILQKPSGAINASQQDLQTYEILNQDRQDLSALVDEINELLVQLPTGQLLSSSKRVLSTLTVLVAWAAYLALMGYLLSHLIKTVLKGDRLEQSLKRCVLGYDRNSSEPCSKSLIKKKIEEHMDDEMYSLLGLFGGIMASLIPASIHMFFAWHYNKTIPQHAWQNILSLLENHVLERLHALENRDGNNVPGGIQNLRSLEIQAASLHHSQPRDEAITIFTELKTHIETLRREMNRSNQPLSLFFRKPGFDVEAGEATPRNRRR